MFNADSSWPIWENDASGDPSDAFEFASPETDAEHAVVSSVTHPYLFGFKPQPSNDNKRAILILGGGGYIELMVGREGIQVARWLNTLGFHAFVLVHRFPNSTVGASAPLDDARRALNLIQQHGHGASGISICGLSSGGHLAASLLAAYPASWTPKNPSIPPIAFAIIGYAPISTNAAGRTIIPNKPALAPPEKQHLYDTLQPDTQLLSPVPPVFIVYSGNDPVVPVVNAYRLAEGCGGKGGKVEVHVFADAPHGFGVDTVGLPVAGWTGLCEGWLGQGGFLG